MGNWTWKYCSISSISNKGWPLLCCWCWEWSSIYRGF